MMLGFCQGLGTPLITQSQNAFHSFQKKSPRLYEHYIARRYQSYTSQALQFFIRTVPWKVSCLNLAYAKVCYTMILTSGLSNMSYLIFVTIFIFLPIF